VARGHSGTVFVDIQNDGLRDDTLHVTGPGGSQGFTLTYYRDATNVTGQVVSGTFSTGSLARGGHMTLKVVVHLSATSANSAYFLVTARSVPGVPVDAVKVTVHAT
jgi:hypothetical protein